MIRFAIRTLAFIGGSAIAIAQTFDVNIDVDAFGDHHPISPLIYGVNNGNNAAANLASRRLGGDRYTTYNWENNASNSGHWTDDPQLDHISDANVTGYVPSDIPAKAIIDFHDTSIANGTYSLVTLQSGFVARDINGVVSAAEAIPNMSRWRAVKYDKGAPLLATPDLNDENVYIDEMLGVLIGKYGTASTPTGIKGYGISNEPGLWHEVHPRSHPVKEGYADIFAITTALASTVKRMDPNAEVYGGVTYGFGEMKDFQGAPDKASYSQYKWYIDALLASTKAASDAAGKRIVDALDVHWYSEAEGDTPGTFVAWGGNTPDLAAARMQAPRSLWDPAYVERSWITGEPGRFSHSNEVFGSRPLMLIRRLRESIATYNPGTKIAFGEFGYGGYDHVSGGIAVADALGIFGREGVYYANHWDDITGYVESAYRLYRNYDGRMSTFGAESVPASTSDSVNSSAYATFYSQAATGNAHLIIINKNMSDSMRAHVSLPTSYWRIELVYGFDGSDVNLRQFPTVPIYDLRTFEYTLPPTSAVHMVISFASLGVDDERTADGYSASVIPNPVRSTASVYFGMPTNDRITITLVDALGRDVRTVYAGQHASGSRMYSFDVHDLAAGRYIARVATSSRIISVPVAIVR